MILKENGQVVLAIGTRLNSTRCKIAFKSFPIWQMCSLITKIWRASKQRRIHTVSQTIIPHNFFLKHRAHLTFFKWDTAWRVIAQIV